MSEASERTRRLRQFRKNAGLCIICAQASTITICGGCLNIARIRKAKRYQRIVASGALHPNTARARELKKIVMAAYGPTCRQCSETHLAFLTLDHVDNDGAAHRKTTNGGANLYSKLVTAGFPSGYQCLCWNCNYRKRRLLQLNGVSGEAKATADRARYVQLRLMVFNAYGGPRCQCCDIDDIMVLTIDHIAGGGRPQKQTLKLNNCFYKWLVNNHYPNGYRVLCFNCNCGGFINGGVCPHHTINAVSASATPHDTGLLCGG